MAEVIGLDIVVGMDSDQLQAELQKAQNQLRQFESQLKKSTNTAEITNLNKQIDNLNKSITNLQSGMKGVAKPAADATQSITNLSRIAQDAPYGFMGIANNINPMLESFQRLQKETGSAGGALKAMVAGITGPAGIGLAVGVATSLLTVFSKEIANFFKGPSEKLKEFREELKKVNDDVYKIVGGAQANRAVGLNLVNVIAGGTPAQQQEALKALKALYRDSKEIHDLKMTNDKAYLIHLVNVASKQEELAGKEKNNVDGLKLLYEQRKKIEDEVAKKQAAQRAPTSLDIGMGQRQTLTPEQQAMFLATMKKDVAESYKTTLANIDSQIKSYVSREGTFIEQITGFDTPGKSSKSKTSVADAAKIAESNEVKQLKTELSKMKSRRDKAREIGLDYVSTYEDPEEKQQKEDKKTARFNKFVKSELKGAAGEGMNGKKSKVIEDLEKERELQLANIALAAEKQKSYERFAETVSSTLTNSIMGLWNAFEQGKSVGEALSNMFMDLAKQIAAAAIKAAIFTTIMNVIAPGTGAAVGGAFSGGGGMGLGMFGSLLGLADGGVVTKPTLAMVGEGNQHEAVMPLSKLGNMMNNTFNAGAMAGNGGAGSGQFTLRGSDLVLALNRSNYSLNLRRGA
jgi:hypothetical protein